MLLAVLTTVAAGILHAHGLSESNAGTAGVAFGLGFLAVVFAITALPHELAKALGKKDSDRS